MFSIGVIGEVVPAREGLRPFNPGFSFVSLFIGEVVPAREGLRPNKSPLMQGAVYIGEVVPAREGLRLYLLYHFPGFFTLSEKWFQQEKD